MCAAAATILFLASNPAQTAHLALDEEARAIENELRRAAYGDAFRLEHAWAPRPDDLQLALNEHSPAILHFAGHGEGEPGLVLAGEHGEPLPVSGRALRRLLEAFPRSIRLVVLNACYSDEQCHELTEAVGCTIGMSARIGDRAARRFAAAFYAALGAGRSVRSAFQQAVALIEIHAGAPRPIAPEPARHGVAGALAAPRPGYAEVPVLRTRADVDADRLYFVASAPSAVRAAVAAPMAAPMPPGPPPLAPAPYAHEIAPRSHLVSTAPVMAPRPAAALAPSASSQRWWIAIMVFVGLVALGAMGECAAAAGGESGETGC